MNDTYKQKLKQLIKNDRRYIEKLLKIRTKKGDLVNFQFNVMQLKLDEKIEELRQQGKPVRVIILKARQMGASTYTEGKIFKKTATTKLTNSLIIAHKEDASTNLFNMSKLFYEELPQLIRPMKKASNAKELLFENPTADPNEKQVNPGLRSKIKIDTAKNLGAGRSETIHNLHASEVAFWDNAETVMLGLMQAVPNTPNTMVVIESTANGVGGYFYDMWQQAKRGENDFIPLFFAWFEHPEYKMAVPPNFTLDEEEKELKELYHLDSEQLAWRRWAIRNNCGGDPDKFKQEYPSNDMESFMTSGRPRFDVPTLTKWLSKSKPGEQGNIEHKQWIPQAKGYITVWDKPKPGKKYVIGADVAEGLVNGDYSAAPVWDAETWKMVAKWHGHIDPDLYGDELAKIGKFYNTALIAVEKNNHGFTTLNRLKNLDYPQLFHMEKYDEVTDKSTKQLGWQTNRKTKPLAVDFLARCIREELITVHDSDFISECITYVRGDDGTTNAQEGCTDDLVMGGAIGLFVLSNYSHEYFEVIESNALRNKANQDHLPYALRDDEDNHYNWSDL
jgi:hypothetical protein